MRKTLFSLLALAATNAAFAQAPIDFESLTLPKADTFYVNYSQPLQDVGFDVMSIHFPCVYDTAYGGMWSKGFAYSNMTDSVTSGYTNQYAAKPAKGYNGSDNYLVYWDGYGSKPKIVLPGEGEAPYIKRFSGFYITNTTYAYNSMRDGDFAARKFGDTTGTNSGLAQGSYPDWFKLTVRGYDSGTLLNDSVEFYLADYRFNDNDSDYIVGDWRWVDLSALGGVVDSVAFYLSSSDNGAWGMNTPAYFCMDNLTPLISTDVKSVQTFTAKVYPNPVVNELHIALNDAKATTVSITDLSGKQIMTYPVSEKHLVIPTSQLPQGMYLLNISNGTQMATQRFLKK
jgi:hypothetical protein